MKLETIIRAALHDMQTGKAQPHCGNPPYHMNDDEPLNGIEWAEGYAEPGYDAPKHGVLFANWNRYPSRLTDILERAGYAIEWSDEWSTCEDCEKAVRTSPDSYSWSPACALIAECSIVCRNCLADNPTAYLEELNGNEHSCLTNALAQHIDVTEHGYEKYNPDSFESGLHRGQNDNPREIAKALRAKGITDFIFVQDEQSQFYIKFSVYVRRSI